MPHKRKKFIDKRNAVTFVLVHRGQRDPLQADEAAPQHVLVEKRTGKVVALGPARSSPSSAERRRDEQRKYGVYFDDDYDYLRHLRDVETVAERAADLSDEPQRSIRLPSSVFRSAVEEREGLLNKAAPQRGPRPDWDPDVVAALDEDFDFGDEENLLEDDFMVLAGGPQDEESGEGGGSRAEDTDDRLSFADEEVRSRFTDYTMSSSAIPRRGGLRTLDERFERMFETYDDAELGALDGEDVEGTLRPDGELLRRVAAEYDERSPTPREATEDADGAVEARPGTEEETVYLETDDCGPREKWDCESILSTYSNLYNRPKLIAEPRKDRIALSPRTGLPVDGRRDVRPPDGEVASRRSTASVARARNETPEERRRRKASVKSLRRERRTEKKANSLAFRAEEKRQERAMIHLRNNLGGIKLV